MGKSPQDLTGQRFGRLTVLKMEKKLTNAGKKRTHALCKCDCGSYKYVLPGNLKSGKQKSCGCLEDESRYHRKHYIDIQGKKFGMLTAISLCSEVESNGSRKWLCQCECGEYTKISYTNLTHGRIKSCGCIRRRYVQSISNDYIGKTFGKLMVIDKHSERSKSGRVLWKCKCECGNITYVTTDSLGSGNTRSCGKCLKSVGEETIASCLNTMGIAYEREYRFEDCRYKKTLPFDFYIPELKTVIEYDGQQHFNPIKYWGGQQTYDETKVRDKIKNDYCKLKNIRLIRIPYTKSSDEIQAIIQNIKNP